MLSRTSQHALRAVIHLVRQAQAAPLSARCIAEQTGTPPKYLASILRTLVQAGVLRSLRGKGGGFVLTRPPRMIALLDIVAPFETGEKRSKCPVRDGRPGGAPGQARSAWHQIIEREERFLRRTTLRDAARRSSPAARGTSGKSKESHRP